MNEIAYQSPYGVWAVTTEGDCEGRYVNHLGTYEGFIDDIAFALADKCYYSLCFSLQEPLDFSKKKTEVNICLNIRSGTWNKSITERVKYFQQFFERRDVTVMPSESHASVKLVANAQIISDEQKRKEALNKLTEEERILLGLTEEPKKGTGIALAGTFINQKQLGYMCKLVEKGESYKAFTYCREICKAASIEEADNFVMQYCINV